MKVWIYVEGKSDAEGLKALWGGWMRRLGQRGWGIRFVPLANKQKFLRKITARASEKLLDDPRDLVVGLSDLYPIKGIAPVYKHENLTELRDIQTRLVESDLRKLAASAGYSDNITRFYASAFKYDMEVLLLAATGQLQSRLRMANKPRGWRRPPEHQNQNKPPKRVVEELFRTSLKRRYNDITDSGAILKCADLHDVATQCPTFRAMIDWIGEKTGVPAY